MARPTKQGIDYFPMDCVPDSSLELFIAENGAAGFGLLAMIWQRIYRDDGYFIRNDDDLVLRLRRDSLLDMETTVSIIANAIKRGLFDKDMHERFGILTSRGIQRRYFNGAKQKKQAKIYADFCLIDIKEYGNAVSINGNPDNIDGNATKVKVNVKVNVKEESSPCDMPSRGPESKKSLPKSFLDSEFKDEAYEFADWFRTIAPESVKFDRGKWALVWYHLRETDGRQDKEEILRAIQWARGDPFWSTNFHSPLKLRKRNDDGVMYIDLFIEKMKQSKRRNNAANTTQDGNPHAIANLKMLAALERGDFAESPPSARDGPEHG